MPVNDSKALLRIYINMWRRPFQATRIVHHQRKICCLQSAHDWHRRISSMIVTCQECIYAAILPAAAPNRSSGWRLLIKTMMPIRSPAINNNEHRTNQAGFDMGHCWQIPSRQPWAIILHLFFNHNWLRNITFEWIGGREHEEEARCSILFQNNLFHWR